MSASFWAAALMPSELLSTSATTLSPCRSIDEPAGCFKNVNQLRDLPARRIVRVCRTADDPTITDVDEPMSQRALPSILVVEDDLDLRQTIVASLESNGFAAAQAADAADAIERLRSFAHDGLVVDLRLPDADGMTALDEALDRYPEIRAIVMTGFGGVAEAVAAIKRGAVDFLIKPFQLSQLSRVLHAGLEQQRLREENAELKAQLKGKFRFENIIGRHSTMQALFTTLELVSPMNSMGIDSWRDGHRQGIDRAHDPSQQPACQRALRGLQRRRDSRDARRGGTLWTRQGRLHWRRELARRSFRTGTSRTLFIDEVASMSLPLQAKLLRALQEREIERVGESRPLRLDIRVIAATNTDLRKLVKDGTFRDDLFYRLNVIPVTLPALRQRREDIPLLAQHFAKVVHREQHCHQDHDAGRFACADGVRLAGEHPSVRERRGARRGDGCGEIGDRPRSVSR